MVNIFNSNGAIVHGIRQLVFIEFQNVSSAFTPPSIKSYRKYKLRYFINADSNCFQVLFI